MNHIYKSEWKKRREQEARKAFFMFVVVVACFLIAMYFDHKDLMAGILK